MARKKPPQGPVETIAEPSDEGINIIHSINAFRTESEDARRTRLHNMDRNWDAFLGRQDFSHKIKGQSREFLPKVPVSVEQLSAMIKRSLVQFGDFFSVRLDADLEDRISGDTVRELLKPFLNDLWGANNKTQVFSTTISDAVKQALLKSLIILKIHGGNMKKRTFRFEQGAENPLVMQEDDEWHLRIDLCRVEDYYPDPTGNGLYEIHRVERDLHNVLEMAEAGIYNMAMVRQLIGTDHKRPEDEKLKERDRNQGETTTPSFRKRVVLDEFWGTLLNSDGTIAHRNVVATVANERFLIRPPEPNPFWHQESPFVVAPLLRVPHSVWHKAMFDHATDLNLALNELFNLMVDGGLASVWGVSQIRTEDLEDPSQIANGIRQGITLAVKQTLPHNSKVYEKLSEGSVPPEALQMFAMLGQEFSSASMTSELKLGAMPPANQKIPATAILESSQTQNLMLDGMVADIENEVMAPALRKSWLTVLQNADALPDSAFSTPYDRKVGLIIMRASPEERFAMFAGKTQFNVFGLSATMTRALDFQKIMALLQAVGTNPLLLQAFMAKFSPDKTLVQLLRTLNINPATLFKSREEQANDKATMERTAGAAKMLQAGPKNAEGQAAGVASGPGTGGSPMTATIQQGANPASGMPNT